MKNNKRASDRWIRTDGLACMHENQEENNYPQGLIMLKQLYGQFAQPGRNAGSTLSREIHTHSHCPCVNTLIAVVKLKKWITRHLEDLLFKSLPEIPKHASLLTPRLPDWFCGQYSVLETAWVVILSGWWRVGWGWGSVSPSEDT